VRHNLNVGCVHMVCVCVCGVCVPLSLCLCVDLSLFHARSLSLARSLALSLSLSPPPLLPLSFSSSFFQSLSLSFSLSPTIQYNYNVRMEEAFRGSSGRVNSVTEYTSPVGGGGGVDGVEVQRESSAVEHIHHDVEAGGGENSLPPLGSLTSQLDAHIVLEFEPDPVE